ncbi:MAG TPA: hypothetical protein VHZ96_14925 [Frankiaceae bacterium]|jgi:hypothetical protein|nr:hypothetical protein [Frankiaceae bacterium]
MYLSADRIAVVDKAVQDTFEQSSIAWQAIPHWDTGDRGQFRVRSDNASAPEVNEDKLSPPISPGDSLKLEANTVRFAVTVAQAIAPTPDALLAAVITRTVQLAGRVDSKVIAVLRAGAKDPVNVLAATGATPPIQMLLNALIDARAQLEKFGYRAPSCLLTDTEGLKALNYLQSGLSDFQALLDAANINSVYRVDQLRSDKGPTPAKETEPDSANGQFKGRLLLLGRRQRIPHGGAAATSPGEEPADLAVSVPPSVEVVGETATGDIEMSVRIRFAPRLTDLYGVVNVV